MNLDFLVMDRPALNWHQWTYNNKQLTSWNQFSHTLQIHFAPVQFDDPQGALFQLTQTTTVCDKQSQFESLSNRIGGLPHIFFQVVLFQN